MEEMECCEVKELHEELLKTVADQMPEEEELYDLAELFKVFGDSTESGYCSFCLRQRCASAIWRRRSI